MNFRLTLTLTIAKTTTKVLRFLNKGGTTLPGKIALKLYPDILKILASKFKVIMVTGTNGKTTTSRIIEQMLHENKLPYITNKSGANLITGITTTFISSVDLFGKSDSALALIEIDEAAFKKITSHISPYILVVTNFFRDQLDRFGELNTTVNNVYTGIKNSKNTKLILNSDDSLCASLGKNSPNITNYFGISSEAYNDEDLQESSDAIFCSFCKTRYDYTFKVYGHLGGFECSNCGYKRPTPNVTCTTINELSNSFSNIKFTINLDTNIKTTKVYQCKINLPGLYNIYNALAAISCGSILNIPISNVLKALSSFECGFGRMETIKADEKDIKLILVKNPTGFNQVINFLLTEENKTCISFIINDNDADGTDISWLWDVDFEKLANVQDNIDCFYASGTRAEDMAVRLKYAGIYTNKIKIIHDHVELIEDGLSNVQKDCNFYVLPTYTSLLKVRGVLKKKYNLKEFWK